MGKTCYMSSIPDQSIRPRSLAVDYNISTSITLVDAIKLHDLDLVFSILGHGYREDEIRDEGGALHWAVCKNMSVVVHNLLSIQGLDPNPITKWRSTPLHAAADHNRHDIARMLIQYGADVNAVTNTGNTPCHLAAYRGNSKTLLVLLQHGATIDTKNNSGNTPLEEARSNSRKGAEKLIISYIKRRGLDIEINTRRLSHSKCNLSKAENNEYRYKGSCSGPLPQQSEPITSQLKPSHSVKSLSSENIWSLPLGHRRSDTYSHLHRRNDNMSFLHSYDNLNGTDPITTTYFDYSDDETGSTLSSSSLSSEYGSNRREEFFSTRKSKLPEESCECSSGSLCKCS